MASNITPLLVETIAPALFRLVWWKHLDPTRRDNFAEDLLDLISAGVVDGFQSGTHTTLASPDKAKAKVVVRLLVNKLVNTLAGSDFVKQIAPYSDSTFEHVASQLLERRKESELNELFAAQYDRFTLRISNLSPSLISAVTPINEEFIIWLKMHPDHTERIHSDAFEQLVGEILTSLGFTVEFVGRIKNKSADLFAVWTNENGVVVKYLVECKRYSGERRVDIKILNAVIGASFRAKTDHAMLVTTSSFTRNVHKVRAELEDFRLDLHDGRQVTEWLSGYQFKEDIGLWLPDGWQDHWRP